MTSLQRKRFCAVPGINGNIGLCLWEQVRPVHEFWLHLVAQVNKYSACATVQNDSGSSNSSMESGLTLQ
jgi:hypothetical protein